MNDIFRSNIRGQLIADEIIVGKGAIVEEGVIISGKAGPARKIVLGDFCYIGQGTKILVPEFYLGDYSKLHAGGFCHGEHPLQIGRNCWIGGNCTLDSMGGLDIEDNVGIGSQSQIWTHIQFGDLIEGCRFFNRKYMRIAKDAWFVGHCIVSPVAVGEKSMAMAGSVITKDMIPNHIYAGVPAVDISSKVGHQFEILTIDQKAEKLQNLIDIFVRTHPQYTGLIKVIKSKSEMEKGVTCFDVSRRVYNKLLSEAEVTFLKNHVPLIKFTPDGCKQFFECQTKAVR